MRAIKEVYDKDRGAFADTLDFGAFHGHLMALKSPEEYSNAWEDRRNTSILPMIPQKFVYKAEDKSAVTKLMDKIKAGNYDYIINACDAGREGEHIFWSFYETVGLKLPVKRFWASSVSTPALKKALNNLQPSALYDNMRQASKFRAQFDWLVGMNFTRAASAKLYSFVPIGRVQSPTLKLIVDREREIQNFKAAGFYEVKGKFNINGSKPVDFIHLVAPNHKTTRFDKQSDADNIVKEVKQKGQGEVLAVKETEKSVDAPTLYSLTELQKDANKYFKFKADKTLSITQKLYEDGLLSYPRTESRFLPTDMIPEISKHLQPLNAVPELQSFASAIGQKEIDDMLKKGYINDAGITDHHAIIPTDVSPNWSKLTKDEQSIYTLVGKSFLAIFMPPYRASVSNVLVGFDKHIFLAKGKREIDKGYGALYATQNKDMILPACKKGDAVTIASIGVVKGTTQPPKRYTPRTILTAMQNAGNNISDAESRKVLIEAEGLGTPASRADILSKLEERGLVEVKSNAYYALEKGINIIDNVGDRKFCSALLTAEWEKKLRDIELGKFQGDFRAEMEQYIKEETAFLLNTLQGSPRRERKIVGKCPFCGGDFYESEKSYYCANNKGDDPSGCKCGIPKVIGGYEISNRDLDDLLSDRFTDKHIILNKKGKEWEVSFRLDSKQGFILKGSERKVVGKCPKCGKDVYAAENNYFCKCKWSFPRVVKGTVIDEKNMGLMLQGKKTEPLNFLWNNGKTGSARLFLKNDLLKWDFVN